MRNLIVVIALIAGTFAHAASFKQSSRSIAAVPFSTSASTGNSSNVTSDSTRRTDNVQISDCAEQVYCKRTLLKEVNNSVEEYLITGQVDPFLYDILQYNNIPQEKYDEAIVELYEWLDRNL